MILKFHAILPTKHREAPRGCWGGQSHVSLYRSSNIMSNAWSRGFSRCITDTDLTITYFVNLSFTREFR